MFFSPGIRPSTPIYTITQLAIEHKSINVPYIFASAGNQVPIICIIEQTSHPERHIQLGTSEILPTELPCTTRHTHDKLCNPLTSKMDNNDPENYILYAE